MPLKVNWTRGRYLGILLFYIGMMGLSQSLIIIPISQYVLMVGSLYVLILLPLGITVALTYSAQIIYEANASVTSRSRRYKGKSNTGEILGFSKEVWKPILMVIVVFVVIFTFVYTMGIESWEPVNAFVIAQNTGGIGSLIFASILENQNQSKKY